jgi:hypothetical protein
MNQIVRAAVGVLSLAAVASAQYSFHRTYFGGSANDRVQGVAVDAAGRIYVTGHTDSTNFASVLPSGAAGYDTTAHGLLDGFVAVLSTDLQDVLYWTKIGGSMEDRAYAVAVQANGDVVVIGFTESPDFPVTTGVAHHGSADTFITRFSPDLKQIRMSTLLGGSGYENPRDSFCVDASGNIYIGGATSSLDFPATPGAFQTTHAVSTDVDDWDGYLAKLSPSGQVLWATYIGGSKNDDSYSGTRLGADGSIYIAGMTNSVDFPVTPNAFQHTFGGNPSTTNPYIGDGFVARFTPDGSALIFCTYLGGSDADMVGGNDVLELDSAGNAVVMGGTRSVDFPVTAGAFDTHCECALANEPDMFIAKVSADGTTLIASTFLGGEQPEEPSGLDIDVGGAIYFSGNTTSNNFPVTLDANQPIYATGGDAFVGKISPDLTHLLYSSYIGGHGHAGSFGDRGRALTLTPNGEVLIGGDTDSYDLPLPNYTYQDHFNGGNEDGFITLETINTSHAFGMGKLNSLSTRPVMTMVGSPSLQSGSFDLHVAGAVPLRNGVFAYGSSLVAVPYFGGTVYMGQPIQRAARIATDALGEATATLPVTPDLLGQTRIYQYWYRDPAHPDGTHAGLSNAFKVTYVP